MGLLILVFQLQMITNWLIYIFLCKQIKLMHSNTKTNIFTYGSLMYPEVIYGIVKNQHYQSEPALLKGYGRFQVRNASYPGIIKCEGKSVKGLLYRNVTEEDLQRLNRFEGSEYEPHQITVETQNGEKVKAVAYLYLLPANLQKIEWDVENFEKNHKKQFAFLHVAPK